MAPVMVKTYSCLALAIDFRTDRQHLPAKSLGHVGSVRSRTVDAHRAGRNVDNLASGDGWSNRERTSRGGIVEQAKMELEVGGVAVPTLDRT